MAERVKDNSCKVPGCKEPHVKGEEYCYNCRLKRKQKCQYFEQKEYKRAAGRTWVPWCTRDDTEICQRGGLKCYGCKIVKEKS